MPIIRCFVIGDDVAIRVVENDAPPFVRECGDVDDSVIARETQFYSNITIANVLVLYDDIGTVSKNNLTRAQRNSAASLVLPVMNRFPIYSIGCVDDMGVPVLQHITRNQNPIVHHLVICDGVTAGGIDVYAIIAIRRYSVICDGIADGGEEVDAIIVV